MEKQKIRELIAQSKLREAARLMIALTEKQKAEQIYQDRALILSMQLHNLEKKISMDQLNWERESEAKIKVASGMLTLLNDL